MQRGGSKQTFSAGLPLALGGEVVLELLCTDLILFDLLASKALDLLEELRDFVGHLGGGGGVDVDVDEVWRGGVVRLGDGDHDMQWDERV